MAASPILAILSLVFFAAALLRLRRDAWRIGPASRTWLIVGAVFAVVAAWLSTVRMPDQPSAADSARLATTSATTHPGSSRSQGTLLLAYAGAEQSVWLAQNADGSPPRTLGTTPGAATLWALDDTQGVFYARSEDALWQGSWRGAEGSPQRVSGLPPAAGAVHAAWVDAGTGALRALEMLPATAVEARDMLREPPDARPYWAVLWELQAGIWRILERRPTSWGVDGSVGPTIFRDLWRERGRSARAIEEGASCVTLCDESVEAPLGVDAGSAEEWRALPGTEGRVVFGVALGEVWHPVGPVLLRLPGQGARVVAAGNDQGLHLQRHGDWLLVTPAELPSAPRLIDLRDGSARDLRETLVQPAWVD